MGSGPTITKRPTSGAARAVRSANTRAHVRPREEEKKVVWQGKGGNAAIQRRKNLENRQPRLLSDFRFRLYPAVRVRVRPPRPQEAKASE